MDRDTQKTDDWPVWARADWIAAKFGVGRDALMRLVERRIVRSVKTGQAAQCGRVFRVADLDAYMCAEAGPLAEPPAADTRPEATEADIAEFMRAVAAGGARRHVS